jgi:hypothetical protein
MVCQELITSQNCSIFDFHTVIVNMKVRTDVGARHGLISAYPVRHYLDAPLSATHSARAISTLSRH